MASHKFSALKVFCVLFVVLILSGCWVLLFLYHEHKYLPGQSVNDIDVSMKTPVVVQSMLCSALPPVKVTTNGDTIDVYSVLDYNVDSQALYQTFADWIRRVPIQVNASSTVNYDAMRNWLQSKVVASYDATIDCTDGVWSLNPEVLGYDIDVDAVLSAMKATDLRDVDLDAYLRKPSVTANDLQESFQSVSWLNDFMFSYASGFTLNGATLSDYVEDYTLTVPDDFLQDFVKEATASFNTVGDVTVLNPETGEEITQTRVTLKKTVNVDKELAYLKEAIQNHDSEMNRTPIMSGYDEISGTYILVSLEDQHLWYVKDDEVYMQTDVVTGTRGVHDTPTGAYYISECIPGKTLRGEGYETWVNQWMRLTNSGVGLHDAYWRSKFGGKVYTYNGSHGCINLPKAFAKDLYAEAYVGMPVIVY